jgi:hypothetical protein
MHTSNAIARALDMKRDPPSVRGVKRTVDLNIVRWTAQDVHSISCRTSAGSEYSQMVARQHSITRPPMIRPHHVATTLNMTLSPTRSNYMYSTATSSNHLGGPQCQPPHTISPNTMATAQLLPQAATYQMHPVVDLGNSLR